MPVTVHRDVECAEGSGQSHPSNYQPIITTAPWYWVRRAATVFQLIMQIPPFCYYLCFACEDISSREISLDTSTISWIHHTSENWNNFSKRALWSCEPISKDILETYYANSLVIGMRDVAWKEVEIIFRSFPGGSVVKNLPANAGDVGSIPGSGRSPGEGNGSPLQYSCLGNPMDRATLLATVPHGVMKE